MYSTTVVWVAVSSTVRVEVAVMAEAGVRNELQMRLMRADLALHTERMLADAGSEEAWARLANCVTVPVMVVTVVPVVTSVVTVVVVSVVLCVVVTTSSRVTVTVAVAVTGASGSMDRNEEQKAWPTSRGVSETMARRHLLEHGFLLAETVAAKAKMPAVLRESFMVAAVKND